MTRTIYSKFIFCACTLVFSAGSFAQDHPFYVAANAGIIQGNFSNSYLDQTDIIKQNIAESVEQHGYTGGLAIGYSKLYHEKYLLGAELSGNLDSHNATFQSGAASSAFSDTTQINNHFDLTFVPGILLSESTSAYLKLGVSVAYVEDNLTSPAGFGATPSPFNSSNHATGFAAGLGIQKSMSERVSVFAEGDYHDYGTVNFANFQNFSTSYIHSAHVYSYGVVLGMAYHW